MASQRKSAEDWVRAALGVLASSSIADVKVERLAEDLGMTKGSFYWHFADRDALLEGMRQLWVRLDTERVIELVEQSGSDGPVEDLRALARFVLGTTSDLDGVEAGIREWSAIDPATAAVCAEVDERRLGYVSGLLESAGVPPAAARRRADLIYRIVIGEYVWRRHGGNPIDIDTALSLVDHLARP